MEKLSGSFGTSASLALRYGQTFFSAASLSYIYFAYDYYDYTIFCYMTTLMGCVTAWSISLTISDTYSVFMKQLDQDSIVLSILVAGDFVLAFLCLGGACAVASVIDLRSSYPEHFCVSKFCDYSQDQVLALVAFLCWFLFLASALFNLWSLPSSES